MHKAVLVVLAGGLLVMGGYIAGTGKTAVVHAGSPMAMSSAIPRSYGKLVTAIPDSIGTGLIFEDKDGTIRFVSMTGMKEGELARYDEAPTHGGIPKSYGHLVSAVVNNGSTGLIFEDGNGVIRLVTITGATEAELSRN